MHRRSHRWGPAAPHHPLGLPPDFITNGAQLGLVLDATPTIPEVWTSRAVGLETVRAFLADVTPEQLDGSRASFGQTFTVLGAIQIVIFEEWAHHVYATRDLTALESP